MSAMDDPGTVLPPSCAVILQPRSVWMVSLSGRAVIAVEGEAPDYEENQRAKATQPQTCTPM